MRTPRSGVGFLYGQFAPSEQPLVVMTRYVPVPDDQYVVDDTVGARINGDAIRAAMQGVLDTGDGVFHTHLHEWPGTPSVLPDGRRGVAEADTRLPRGRPDPGDRVVPAQPRLGDRRRLAAGAQWA